ncbi:MAG: hypothetical protein JO254_11740 [Pseudolabrys sp.]|nr:hypothetical protein [Pseudolabrys sp.]
MKESAATAAAAGMKPVIVNFPGRGEVIPYLRTGTLPTSTSVLERRCETEKLVCLFPIKAIGDIFRGADVLQFFAPGGHYSPMGNKAIGSWIYGELRRHDLLTDQR